MYGIEQFRLFLKQYILRSNCLHRHLTHTVNKTRTTCHDIHGNMELVFFHGTLWNCKGRVDWKLTAVSNDDVLQWAIALIFLRSLDLPYYVLQRPAAPVLNLALQTLIS